MERSKQERYPKQDSKSVLTRNTMQQVVPSGSSIEYYY